METCAVNVEMVTDDLERKIASRHIMAEVTSDFTYKTFYYTNSDFLSKQHEVIEERKSTEVELAPSTSSTTVPPADAGERVPGFDEVDDRPPSSTVVTQKEEVMEQIIDQGESISESTK